MWVCSAVSQGYIMKIRVESNQAILASKLYSGQQTGPGFELCVGEGGLMLNPTQEG